ncbi:MAG: EAL domain-containing protein [Saccharospirillum sp.]
MSWVQGAQAVWIDRSGQATPEQALRALDNATETHLPAFSRSPVWARYDVSIATGDSANWVLSNENPIVPVTDVHLFDTAGDRQQSLALGHLADPPQALQRQQGALSLQPGESYQLLVRLHSSTPLAVALRWVPESALSEHNQQRYARYWVMLSVALAMLLFNVVLLLGRRDAAYSWFMAFHGSVIFYFAGLTGYGYFVLPAALVQGIAQHILAFNFILLFLLYRFALSYLSQPEVQSVLLPQWMSRLVQGVLLASAPLALVVDNVTMFGPYVVIQTLTLAPLLWLCWQHIRQGYSPAWLVLASILIQVTGGTLATLAYMGLVAPNLWLLNAFFISTVIELLLMSFAVVVRMRYLERRQQALLLRDSDTGLPNLLYLEQVLTQQWPQLKKRIRHPALVMIELSGFKSALQLMGPGQTQQLWIKALRDWNDTLLIYDWVVPLPELDQRTAVLIWSRNNLVFLADSPGLERIEQNLVQWRWRSFELEEQSHELEIRLAAYPLSDSGESLDEALRKVNVAQVTGTQQRRFFQPYESAQDAHFNRQSQLIRALHSAIEREELACYVQPILDLHSDSIVAGEVLLRWHHEQFGWVSPAEFIPLAEQMDWMSDITLWVFQQVAHWQSTAQGVLPLSVNLSVLDLERHADRTDLAQRLSSLALDLGLLKVEVTETVMMSEPEDCVKSLNRLRQQGCQVSIDDFGTGYSSLAYLSRTRPDEIKIDRAFIKSLTASTVDRGIVSSIVQLARGIGAQVVAEGVEDADSLKDCIALGIDRAQGFGIARPMPLSEFACWLSDYQRFTSEVSNSSALARPGSGS